MKREYKVLMEPIIEFSPELQELLNGDWTLEGSVTTCVIRGFTNGVAVLWRFP